MPHDFQLEAAGLLWPVHGSHGFAVSLGAGLWSVLKRRPCGEYTLDQVKGLMPAGPPRIPVKTNWETSFNVLAAAHGIGTTWAKEHDKYREAGLARAAKSVLPDSTHVPEYEHREADRRQPQA